MAIPNTATPTSFPMAMTFRRVRRSAVDTLGVSIAEISSVIGTKTVLGIGFGSLRPAHPSTGTRRKSS